MSGPTLHLAVEIDGEGAHPAENAGFTLITLDDGVLPPGASPDPVGRIGAVERAAFLAASTSTIGIAPVVPVT